MVVYAQWYEQIHTYEAGLTALGETFVSTTGPAGIVSPQTLRNTAE